MQQTNFGTLTIDSESFDLVSDVFLGGSSAQTAWKCEIDAKDAQRAKQFVGKECKCTTDGQTITATVESVESNPFNKTNNSKPQCTITIKT
jgi:hypothetical protein